MMRDSNAVLWDAIAFAARAHRHQVRKDGQTPYVSHVFRVAMILSHVFGIDDERILAAAVLHDTIEDTLTDCDELIEHFGPEIAGWVAVLTKDKRLPEPEREAAYLAAVCAADWPVHLIKLADLYDNIQDSKHLQPGKWKQSLAKWKAYLEALKLKESDKSRRALEIVSNLGPRLTTKARRKHEEIQSSSCFLSVFVPSWFDLPHCTFVKSTDAQNSRCRSPRS